MTKRPRPTDESLPDLDTWADALMTTDAVDGVRQRAKSMADDTRLAAKDREFAQAQVVAIQRAARRKRLGEKSRGNKKSNT